MSCGLSRQPSRVKVTVLSLTPSGWITTFVNIPENKLATLSPFYTIDICNGHLVPVAIAAPSSTIPGIYASLQSSPQPLLAPPFSTIVIHFPSKRRQDPFRHESPPQIASFFSVFGCNKARHFRPTAIASLPSSQTLQCT